jgi:hypothetical protein
MEINQPQKVKLEMRGSKLRSGVNWQGIRPKTRPWYIGSENGFSLSMFLCM